MAFDFEAGSGSVVFFVLLDVLFFGAASGFEAVSGSWAAFDFEAGFGSVIFFVLLDVLFFGASFASGADFKTRVVSESDAPSASAINPVSGSSAVSGAAFTA